jgi:KUP system potassium uptake protein
MNATIKRPESNTLSPFGIIATMGIVFGVLGTSPLYTMKAILSGSGGVVSDLLIYGSLSCIFWTLTLTTTIKYVTITLRADNKGEGGIFALYALMKRKSTWAAVLTMIGGGALLADGILTPSITVTSAVEGLNIINPGTPVLLIVLIIIAALFFVQQFGTGFSRGTFGPVMLVWFALLGILGIVPMIENPSILKAVSPVYAYRFISEYPGGFVLLGAVFLSTTGAEVLYANLGNYGRRNIRISWIFVKLCLLLNYFGQGAWLLLNEPSTADINPFYAIMPQWLLLPGILLATAAAVTASQAIIRCSFTLISEAVSLNFWPKIRILHPTPVRGQVFIPFVNWVLWIACSIVIFSFRKSSNFFAPYALAVIITEIITTLLLSFYLFYREVNHRLISLLAMIYLTIEGGFLLACLYGVSNGGWLALLIGSVYFILVFGWFFGRKIKNRYITFANLNNFIELFKDLSKDESVPKTATNLVYIIRANRKDQVESKVIFSIFNKQPKRADRYWFIHVDRVNDPNRFEYNVTQIIPGILIRVDFHIGFKIEPKINLYFREVLEDLETTGEISLESGYDSLKKFNIPGDFKFILIVRIIPRDYKLSNWENLVLALYRLAGKLSITDIRSFQLDSTITTVEQVPILINQPSHMRIRRIE